MFIKDQINVDDCSEQFMRDCIEMADHYTAPFQDLQKEKFIDIMTSYFGF